MQSSTSAGTLATEAPVKQVRAFDIPIKNTLLEPKHYRAIGESIWFFLWCVDRITREVVDEAKGGRIGLVLGSMPHHDADIARSLGCSTKTLRRWRKRLVDNGYLGCLRTPNGYVLWVNKSKKWTSSGKSGAVAPKPVGVSGQKCPVSPKANTPTCPVDLPNVSSRVDSKGKCNKTLQLTSPWTLAEERTAHSASLLSEKLVFSAYERVLGEKPKWRKTERQNLERLNQRDEVSEVVAALEVFLTDASEYLLQNKHPFSCFAKQFDIYRDRAREQRQNDLKADFLDDVIDEVEENVNRELIDVEIARTGRRDRCHPDTAKIWFSNGYARPCEQKPKPEVIEVDSYGTRYWIERKRAQKYLAAGIIKELQTA